MVLCSVHMPRWSRLCKGEVIYIDNWVPLIKQVICFPEAKQNVFIVRMNSFLISCLELGGKCMVLNWIYSRSLLYWVLSYSLKSLSGGVSQCVTRLTRNVEVMGSTTIKGPHCILEQETLPLLLSTGWFQKWIRAWFHNQTKINWGPYGRLT